MSILRENHYHQGEWYDITAERVNVITQRLSRWGCFIIKLTERVNVITQRFIKQTMDINAGPSLWAGHRGPGPPPTIIVPPPNEARLKKNKTFLFYIIIYIINAPFTCMGPSQLKYN